MARGSAASPCCSLSLQDCALMPHLFVAWFACYNRTSCLHLLRPSSSSQSLKTCIQLGSDFAMCNVPWSREEWKEHLEEIACERLCLSCWLLVTCEWLPPKLGWKSYCILSLSLLCWIIPQSASSADTSGTQLRKDQKAALCIAKDCRCDLLTCRDLVKLEKSREKKVKKEASESDIAGGSLLCRSESIANARHFGAWSTGCSQQQLIIKLETQGSGMTAQKKAEVIDSLEFSISLSSSQCSTSLTTQLEGY